tara:strand:- start:4993 stop:5436 length:444 start_codon:yes stop_codon:yes gene_type:complete
VSLYKNINIGDDMTIKKKQQHPNSLANLAPRFTPENAKEAQLKAAAARKINREARERLSLTAAELKMDADQLMAVNNLTALDVMRLSMVKAIANGDTDQAVDIAKALAEFETPKLGRIEQTNIEVKAEDMSDEELDAKLKLLIGGKT